MHPFHSVPDSPLLKEVEHVRSKANSHFGTAAAAAAAAAVMHVEMSNTLSPSFSFSTSSSFSSRDITAANVRSFVHRTWHGMMYREVQKRPFN